MPQTAKRFVEAVSRSKSQNAQSILSARFHPSFQLSFTEDDAFAGLDFSSRPD